MPMDRGVLVICLRYVLVFVFNHHKPSHRHTMIVSSQLFQCTLPALRTRRLGPDPQILLSKRVGIDFGAAVERSPFRILLEQSHGRDMLAIVSLS